ncbi:MAG: polysaccharide biosynthesis C-terminal domain-containing protein [Bacteroidetes bacterium]|nr:polysaccharide biosynthesis C-terminal domain-containing protein [Bacteroidota bacterium]MBS1739052.1 polysaccharide biosynthesis C-terminal domain-containing protein [Bacteroidota bacterium]
MGVVFRQSVKSSLATFAGAFLGAAIIYLSTYYLPKQELGFRNILTNYAVLCGQILVLGLHNTMAVYIHRYPPGHEKSRALVSISLVLPAFFTVVASLFYFLLKSPIISFFKPEDIPFIQQYFLWLPIFTLLFAYSTLLETYLVSQLKVAKATFIREVLLRIFNIVLILLYGFNYISFSVLIYGTVMVYLIPIVLLLSIAWKTEAFQFSSRWNVFPKEEKKEIVHFTWYHSLLGATTIFMGMLDTLMIPTLSVNGLRSVPVYVVSVFLISFLMIPYKAMANSTFALLAQAFQVNDKPKIHDIFMRSSANIFIATGAMFLMIVCNLHNATKILPAGYEGIETIVVILALGRMIDMVTGMNDHVLSLSKYYKMSFYISVLLVLMMVAFNWWLIPIYDANGAAIGTTLALIIYNLLKLILVKRHLQIQPINRNTGLIVLAGLAAFIVGYLLPHNPNPFVDAAYRSLSILLVYAVLLMFLKPSEDLNKYLKSIRQNKRLF